MLFCVFRTHKQTAKTGTNLTAINLPNDRSMWRICAMKIAATASYNAVPSIFTVAPTGITNRVTRGSMPISSNVLIVTGIVAELIEHTELEQSLIIISSFRGYHSMVQMQAITLTPYRKPWPNSVPSTKCIWMVARDSTQKRWSKSWRIHGCPSPT